MKYNSLFAGIGGFDKALTGQGEIMTEEQILFKLSQNPDHILCELVKDDFRLAKEIFSEDGVDEDGWTQKMDEDYKKTRRPGANEYLPLRDWKAHDFSYCFHLQQLILAPDKLEYLRGFAEDKV